MGTPKQTGLVVNCCRHVRSERSQYHGEAARQVGTIYRNILKGLSGAWQGHGVKQCGTCPTCQTVCTVSVAPVAEAEDLEMAADCAAACAADTEILTEYLPEATMMTCSCWRCRWCAIWEQWGMFLDGTRHYWPQLNFCPVCGDKLLPEGRVERREGE